MTKKKALENHQSGNNVETRGGNNQSRRQISIIIDADDKNCLVQLTVAQKLNQGVRQWP
jgi:hypothetical protein